MTMAFIGNRLEFKKIYPAHGIPEKTGILYFCILKFI